MDKLFLILGLIIIISFTGCQSAGSVIEKPEIENISVQISPSLSAIKSNLIKCIQGQTGVTLSINEVSTNEQSFESADLLIRWSATADFSGSSQYMIGQETLIPIVHPDNPMLGLTEDDLRKIFTGETRTWNIFNPAFSENDVQIWIPMENADIWLLFSQMVLQGDEAYSGAWIAASPEAMRNMVAKNPDAIGILPLSWLNESVRSLELPDALAAGLSQPILAITAVPPEGNVFELLLCLQSQVE